MNQPGSNPDSSEKGTTPEDDRIASVSAASSDSPVDRIKADSLKARVVEILKTCYDPEIPVDIYELGLIYRVDCDAKGNVEIDMTLTSPACPVAGSLPIEVENKVRSMDGVARADVQVVWDPPWSPERMSDAARLTLNI